MRPTPIRPTKRDGLNRHPPSCLPSAPGTDSSLAYARQTLRQRKPASFIPTLVAHVTLCGSGLLDYGRVVVVRRTLDLCAFRQHDWFDGVIRELPAKAVMRDAQNGFGSPLDRPHGTRIFPAKVHNVEATQPASLECRPRTRNPLVVWISCGIVNCRCPRLK